VNSDLITSYSSGKNISLLGSIEISTFYNQGCLRV
jgi:hypothetical protein